MAFKQVRKHLTTAGFFPKSEELEMNLSIRREILADIKNVEKALEFDLSSEMDREFRDTLRSLYFRLTLINTNIRKERIMLFKIKNFIINNFELGYLVLESKLNNSTLCRTRSKYCKLVLEKLNECYSIYLRAENAALKRKLEWTSYVALNRHNFNLLENEDCSEDDYSSSEEAEEWAKHEAITAHVHRFKRSEPEVYGPYHCPLSVEVPPRDPVLLDKIKNLNYLHLLNRVGSLFTKPFVRSYNYITQNIAVVYQKYWSWSQDLDKGEVDYENHPEIAYRFKHIEDKMRLRMMMRVRNRLHQEYYTRTLCHPEMADAETEGAHGSSTEKQEQASNVILTSSVGESSEIAAKIEPSLGEWCSSEISPSYQAVVDRWIQIDTFEWSKDSSAGSILKRYDLPYYMLGREDSLCKIPNTIPFTIHRYWRGDLEVKVQISSNKFQVGSLQCAWLYSPDFDANVANRENIYSLSQTHHVLINANTSNEATLYIPYKYHLPYLHTKPRADMPLALRLGRLYISVLNPLSVPTTGSSYCNITVFIRLINSEFTGMLASDIDPLPLLANPEMDTVLKMAEGALHQLNANSNRDNPPVIRAPLYLVPTASHSWAAGTGISEPIHPLRLDARGQTPFPMGVPKEDELNIFNITRVFGLIKTIEWDKDNKTGSLLWNVDASPIFHKQQYYSVASQNESGLRHYVLPPVAFASTMFMAWRGSLEFRFDFVASQYHTGKLMIAYIPGASESTVVNINNMRASTNVVLNLSDTNSYTFKVPFICNKPVWERRFGGQYRPSDGYAPSRVYVGVLNRLIPMQSVSSKVFVNIYVRAGEDFELLIPVQPSIGLVNNDVFDVPDSKSIITAHQGYSPYYSGSFEDFDLTQTFRWGTAAHQISQFTHDNILLNGQVTYCEIAPADSSFVIDMGNQSYPITHAVFVWLDQLGYTVGVPFIQAQDAIYFATIVQKQKKGLNEAIAMIDQATWANTYVVRNTYPPSSKYTSAYWRVLTAEPKPLPPKPAPPSDHSFIMVTHPEGERNEVTALLNVGNLNSTRAGYSLYGEKFFSFKDLGRRYQLYATKILNTINVSDSDKIKFSFPVLPQGLQMVLKEGNNVNEIWNRARDGHIPLICSGFRWYRGGLRFRIVFDSDPDVGVFIQHRPDKAISGLTVQVPPKEFNVDHVANHTYGSYLQLTNVNGIIEFEIPFYLLGLYGLLQTPKLSNTDENNYFSLGDVSVGVILSNLNKTPKNIMATIYYSFADDFGCTTFQGFPPVCFVNDVPSNPRVAYPEMGLPSIKNIIINPIDQAADRISTGLNNTVQHIENNIGVKINQVSEKLATAVDANLSGLTAALESLQISNKELILKISCSLAQIAINPTPISIALGLVNILLDIKLLSLAVMSNVIVAFKDALMSFFSRSSSEQIKEDNPLNPIFRVEPEMDFPSSPKIWIQMVSALFVALSTTFGVKTAPKGVNKFAYIISKGLGDSVRNGSFLITFLTNIFETIKVILKYFISIVHPVESMYMTMEDDIPDIKMWVDEVYYLDGKNLDSIIDTDGYWIERIYSAMLYGKRLLNKLVALEDKQVVTVQRVYEKIKKMYEKAEAMGKHPYVRREPFCVWVSGSPGIGKSFLMEHFSSKLLKAVNYKLKGPKTFVIMPTSQYWTGCRNQPVLAMDDAFSVEMGETLERQLDHMYAVKTSAALNPPMADIKDKNIRYAPEIFYINSNKDFLNIAGLNPDAIHRRRDILIKASLKSEYESMQDVPRDVLQVFGHLEFRIHNNPCDPRSSYGPPIPYSALVNTACDMYKVFYRDETENFLSRLDTYQDLEDDEESGDDIAHHLTLREQMEEIKGKARLQYELDLEDSVSERFKDRKEEFKLYFNKIKKVCTSFKQVGKFLATPEMDDITLADPPSAQPGPSNQYTPPHSTPDTSSSGEIIPELLAVPGPNTLQRMRFNRGPMIRPQPGRCLPESWIGITLYQIAQTHGFNFSARDQTFVTHLMNQIKEEYNLIKFDTTRLIEQFKLYINTIDDAAYFRNKPWLLFELADFKLLDKKYALCCHGCFGSWKWDTREKKYIYNNRDKFSSLTFCPDHCVLEIHCVRQMFVLAAVWRDDLARLAVGKQDHSKLPVDINLHYGDDKFEIHRWLHECPYKQESFLERHANSKLIRYFKFFLTFLASYLALIGTYAFAKFVLAGAINVVSYMKPEWCIPRPSLNPFKFASDALGIAENAYKMEQRPVVERTAVLKTTLAEAGDQNYNNIIRKILNNSFIIKAVYLDSNMTEVSYVGRGLGLNNNRGIFIRHYHDLFLTLPASTKFYIIRDGQGRKGVPLEIDYLKCVTHSFLVSNPKYSSNFFIVEFPPQVPPFKDLRSNIATGDDHRLAGTEGDLISFGDGVKSSLRLSTHQDVLIMGNKQMADVNMFVCYGYSHHGKGLCGSILISKNLPNSPIIGMHVAGANGTGFSEPLFRDIFMQLPKQVVEKYQDLDLEDIPDKTKLLETTVLYVGAEIAEPHRETGKSLIIPSVIHGTFPVDTEPNPLKPSDPRLPPDSSPMILGCEKHGMPVGVFPEKDLKIATEDLTNVMISVVQPPRLTVGVLSLQDAVCGNNKIDHFEPLEWTTSPGYGYGSVRKGHKGKKFLFELKEQEDGFQLTGLHSHLKRIMIEKKKMREQGIVPCTIFTDCLKDTTIPKEKCRVPGKTRIFSISPVDFTIQFKQYFGDFLAGYTKARFSAEHAIGINVHGEEWSQLAMLLSMKGRKIVSGDYSNFGPGLSLQVARRAFDVILAWYRHHGANDKDMLVRECMVREILNAPHLCFDFIYRVCAGIPSGSPITTPLNSLVNSLYIRLAWLELMRESKYDCLQNFHQCVNIVTYGDDIIMNVSDVVIDKFNILKLSEYFSNYKINFTDARKVAAVDPYVSLTETSFLSCNFIPHPRRYGQWCSALKKSSVQGCVNWCHKRGDATVNTIQNCDMALLLAYGWGEEYYNFIKNKCLAALSSKNIKWYPKSWDEHDVRIWDKGMKVDKFYSCSVYDFY